MAIPVSKLKSILTSTPVAYGGAAGAGAYAGHELIPGLMGYEDNPHAVALSTMLNAGTGAAIVNSLKRKALGKELKLLLAGGAAGEMIPMAKDMGDKAIEATKTITDSANRQADAADNALVTKQLSELWKQPATKGIVGGGGAGALAGLATGLLRPRSDQEISDNTSRTLMALKDMGVGGSLGALGGGILGSTKSSSMDKEVTGTGRYISFDELKALAMKAKPTDNEPPKDAE